MINRLRLLRSIGQFDYVDSGGNISLNQYVLIYAENGRGKTTLSAILRSLASGDPISLVERQRLASQQPPKVVIECLGGPPPAIFENGKWNRTLPDIAIFDDQFVDQNVCSGLTVEPEHRQNLHELVLGSEGVALNRQLQGLAGQIEVHIREIRAREAAIPPALRGALSVDEFCGLPNRPNTDDEFRQAERNLAAAREQDSVRTTPLFNTIELPTFGVAALARTLELDLPALDASAAARVRVQLERVGPDGEAWVAEGMHRVIHTDGEHQSCPFCAQDLEGSTVIEQYRVYFGEEYALLRRAIADVIAEVNRLHGREVPAAFERAVRIAAERQQFWSRFCNVPAISINTEVLGREWQVARNGVISVLEIKRAAPLERLEIPEGLLEAIRIYEAQRQVVAAVNERLREANDAIQIVKESAAAANLAMIESDLSNLRLVRTRHSAPAITLCDEYLTAKRDKAVTERAREAAKAALVRYRADAFPSYQSTINTYLEHFNAGYRVDQVSPADTRGGPTCNYSVVINNTPVAIAGGPLGPGIPSFRNVLSSGDRTTLALAFFFSSMDQDRGIARKVVVIDDPISSLDEHRSLTTVQEVRRLGQRASQVIILSHNKSFLCRIWQGIDPDIRTALKIERDANGSTIALWNVDDDSVTEYDRRHAALRSYFTDGPNNNSREIAVDLRLVIEGFLRVAFPEYFPPSVSVLGGFVALCGERTGTRGEILNANDTQELRDLVEYANRFHHDTNPAWQAQDINDGELHAFVGRVLCFAKR
jgi:wobble nucleotide-excising tRNase